MVLSKGHQFEEELQKKHGQAVPSLQSDLTATEYSNEETDSKCNGATETESLLFEASANGVSKDKTSNTATSIPGDVTVENGTNGAVDGGWGWCIIIGCVISRMVCGGYIRAQGILYNKLQDRFNSSATSTALIMSLGSGLRLASGTVVSILTNRYSCRSLTMIGALLSFVGLLVSAFTPNLDFLFFSFSATYGIGRAFAMSPVPILLGYYFEKRRSLAFGLASAGFSFGGIVLCPVIEMLFERYGFQGTFIMMAAISTHMFVSSALYRPIELHRRLTARKRKRRDGNGKNGCIESTMDAERENGSVMNVLTASNSALENGVEQNGKSIINTSEHEDDNKRTMPNPIDAAVIEIDDKKETQSPLKCSVEHANGVTKHELLENHQTNYSEKHACGRTKTLLCLCCSRKDLEKETGGQQKTKWISFSILKDVRFVCFLLSTVCLGIPNTPLFLPALAKTMGISDMNAAYLLSAMAASNTVSRVVSGFMLDLRIFRSLRPQIYCGVLFLESFAEALIPIMTTLEGLMGVSITLGWLMGFRLAQGSVIVMDILGVDKFASSQAITSVLLCFSVFVSPIISGQLMDIYGSYDGAFYLFAAAIFVGACIMSFGLVRKQCTDKRRATENKDVKT